MDAKSSRWFCHSPKLMRADQGAKVSGDGYLTCVMMHEVAHELGPAMRAAATGNRYP